MPTVKLTSRTLAATANKALEAGKATFLWDTELKGFGARISPSGKVSWLVQKWQGGRWDDKEGGKAVRTVIGDSASLSLEDARKKAAIDIGAVSQGVNLAQRKRERRAVIRQENNAVGLLDTFERFVKHKGADNAYWQDVKQRVRKQVIAKLGEKTPVRSITRAQIRTLIEDKKASAPVSARNLFAALRPFFAWCVEQELIPVSPVALLASPKPAKARDRVLTPQEVNAVWQASQSLGYPFGPFFRLLLLTGQRREEVASMRRDEIAGNTWTIPGNRTKNGKAHMVHLSDLALAEIAQACAASADKAYVFSTKEGTSVSGFSKAKAQLDAAMGPIMGKLDAWRIHDLRRTIVSHLAEQGTSPDVADRLLNHVSGTRAGVKGVYQRYDFLAERKQALEDWTAYVVRLTEAAIPDTNVILLRSFSGN